MPSPSVAEVAPAAQASTRERLLSAAIEMFAERGYAATGVDALCKRAGVAKTGLYWEFHSKVGLLNAVVDLVVSEWVDQIRDAARSAASPRERLDVALGAMRQRIRERPEFFRILLVVLAERSQVDDDALVALRRFHVAAHDALYQGIRESVGDLIPAADLHVACDVILSTVQGLFVLAQVRGEQDIDAAFRLLRTAVILLVREQVANAQGRSTLDGRLAELLRAVPAG